MNYSNLAVQRSAFVGYADYVVCETITGWALNLGNPNVPPILSVLIDGNFIETILCDLVRDDIKETGMPVDTSGFLYTIPALFADGVPHTLEFKCEDNTLVLFPEREGAIMTQCEFCIAPETFLEGHVDGMSNGSIHGWVLRIDPRTGKKTGKIPLLVTCNGAPVAQIVADVVRSDVAHAKKSTQEVGFCFRPPMEYRNGRQYKFSFTTVPENYELALSPYTTSFLSHDAMGKMMTISAGVEELFTKAWLLSLQLRSLMPTGDHTVTHYDGWARKYYPALRSRVDAGRILREEPGPLVSVICPVYRPRLGDFLAAVDSVRAQTYQNWELLIVDDASRSPALRALIKDLVASDPRIRSARHATNKQISKATNRALKMARGDYIAFFDHDDLLVDVALEVMVNAALRTRARLLYSDEDKIDDAGHFSEPNLKPDWNHRLLLGQNYICHFVIVDRQLTKQVGPLNSDFDGAQDHDFLLRASEYLDDDDIYHVPELLYHWRKTPDSTAGDRGAKGYTVQAGVGAIASHLQRKGLEAHVASVNNLTIYQVIWKFSEEPRITVIIPFKEQIEMTRRCVEAILAQTEYKNYRIVLVDNWSQSVESRCFVRELSKIARIDVCRVLERFNYSRLNNLAVAANPSDFYMFLNNDVIITQRNWLRVMVDEAIADPRVAIVGAKLLYPNGMVQHAGVILGVGGIGDHAFKGLEDRDPGYVGRASCAQEYSAVTGACMLCRSSVFEELGGFDEKDLSVAFNDVDLCLKARQTGYKVIYTPAMVAQHHESLSRGDDMAPEKVSRFFQENQVMKERWEKVIQNDPFYNPHFSRNEGMFRDLTEISANF